MLGHQDGLNLDARDSEQNRWATVSSVVRGSGIYVDRFFAALFKTVVVAVLLLMVWQLERIATVLEKFVGN